VALGGYGNDYPLGGAGRDYFLLGGEIQAGGYDVIGDFNSGGVPDYLQLSAPYQNATLYGDYSGGGYAYVSLGGGSGYAALASGVSGAQLQAQTFFLEARA
jgi:hypothetical protein